MNRITLFTKPDCSLCRSVRFVIERVRTRATFEFESVDISAAGNENWFAAYRNDIPVVHLNGCEIFRHHINERELRSLLSTAQDAAS